MANAAITGPLGRVSIGTTIFTIGRTPDNMLVVNDAKASSRHAEIRLLGQHYYIADMGSTNGTFVNEQHLTPNTPRLLQTGDVIRVGDTRLTFDASVASWPDDSTLRASPVIPPTVIASPAQGLPTNLDGNVSTAYGGNNEYGNYDNPISGFGQTIPATPQYQYQSGPMPYPPQNDPMPYPPPPPVAPAPVSRPSSMRTIILVGVALVVILAGLGGFFIIHSNQVAQQNADATSTAITTSHNMATAQAGATQTAQAVATQDVVATQTAIVTSPYPPFTNVALYDTLTSDNGQWDSSSACQFSAGGYQVSIAQASSIQWCLNAKQTFGDMAFQATMTLQQGDCGGLIYRYVDAKNFYLFEVCQDGTYNIGNLISGTYNLLYQNFHASSSIKQGTNQTNTIAVALQGDTVNAYINGTRIDSATSGALANTMQQGSVGFFVDDVSNPTSVIYTNALVWTAS